MAGNDEFCQSEDVLQNKSDRGQGTTIADSRPTQTAVDGEMDLEEMLVEELEIGGVQFGGNAYQDIYRNGNFGVKRGRVNLTRAKIWSMAHFLTTGVIIVLCTGCIILLRENSWYWVRDGSLDSFIVLSPLCGFFGLLTSCAGIYLSFSLAKVPRPLCVFLLARVFALFECLLVFPAILCTIMVASKTRSEDPFNLPHKATNRSTFTGLCCLLVISFVVDWITAVAWLFHWWRWCVCCQCFKSCCIFEPGEPLAPGVPDPPTGLLQECVYICWTAICRSNWTLI